MRRSRVLFPALLLATTLPVFAHDLTIGGSRWCIGVDGIVATIDLDPSLLSKIEGVERGGQDLESRSEAQLRQTAADILQPYVDERLTVNVNGARRARIDRIVKAGGVWQIWLSVHHVRLERPTNAVEIDYRLLLDETKGTHVNVAYLYLSRDGTEGAQRIFDFAQPTWQTTFERGATTWRAMIPGPASPAVARQKSAASALAPVRKGARSSPSSVATSSSAEATTAALAPRPMQTSGEDRASAAASSPSDQALDAAKEPGRSEAWWAHVGRFVLLGIEHILSGYDHIAFLLALVVVAPSLGAVLPIITAFTAAHSITLLLAALRIVAIDSRLVESAIALSICYVAAENLFRKRAAHRWIVTFAFGLVHGFGFASVLQNLVVGKANLVVSVVSFNVGVEVGQLMSFALMLPVLRLLGKVVEPRKTAIIASAVIGLLGCTWVVERGLELKLLAS